MRSSAGSAPGSGSFAAAWLCGANPATANQKPELSSRLPSLPPSPGIAVGCFRLRSVNIAEVGNTRVRWEGKEIRSRGAIFVGAADFQILAPRLLVSIEELWLLPFAPWNREKGSGTPVDADPYPPHPAVRLCLRLRKQLACRRSTRGSRQRDFRPKGSASGHASWDAAGACDPLIALPGEERTPLHGRYPRRACPSPVKAPHAPVIVPAG